MCSSEPVFFHPQISRNLHPWIHPCVLSSVTHEPQFRFVWVQKWPFDLRVSICSLHLRLRSGSVWRFWSHSGRSIWGCPCVYWGHVSVCLPYVAGFGFKPKILSCDKKRIYAIPQKPRLPFHRTNYFILHLKRTSQNASTITSQPQTNFSSLLWQHGGFSALKGPLRTLSLSFKLTHLNTHPAGFSSQHALLCANTFP